ncbi:Lrp/AsnC family transcriptional regulator [Pleomorphovibrio marinus]|uniref:Lrp/AsnC family transcriptional regulator n=1 Tax=Pleomorphovibrio marinus TaxID=2164132 RepID=UPI000E0A3092|nr:Lrp/AsnC family transcriptional regulator [Pleomorphovibrio marinus]
MDNNVKVKFDKIDRKILEILQANAKITNAQLSKDIGLSPAPTLERVKKLEQSGIIKSYHAKLDPEKIGLGVSTFVLLGLVGHNKTNIEAFMKEIHQIPEVIECHHITGTGDFILKIISKDINSYQKLMLEKVSEIKEVDSMQSMVILSTFKDSKVLPIPA